MAIGTGIQRNALVGKRRRETRAPEVRNSDRFVAA